jgi:hypothetical protein
MSAKKSGVTEEVTEPTPEGSGINLEDFVAYLPTGTYIFTPCREPWVGKSINSILPPVPVLDKQGKPKRKRDKNGVLQPVTISPTRWLDNNRGVSQMARAPGYPTLIRDRLVIEGGGGWIERNGVMTFNLYRPPQPKLGDAAGAGPWIAHVKKIFEPADAEHIIMWLAHRVQFPASRSITPWCSEAHPALARIPCSRRSSTRSARGIFAT